MRLYLLIVVLFLGLVFVSGQTGLGVPTPWPRSSPQIASMPLTQDEAMPWLLVGNFDGDNVKDFAYLKFGSQTFGLTSTIYIFSGSSGAILFSVALPALTPYTTLPQPTYNSPGRTSWAIGDLTGDNIDELIVGRVTRPSPGGTTGFSGNVYVYEVTSGSMIYSISSPNSDLGSVVAFSGDLNNNGLKDIVVEEPSNSLIKLYDGSNFLIGNVSGVVSGYGKYLASIQDIDADGIDDIIEGVKGFGTIAGRVVVYSGATKLPIYTILSTNILGATNKFGEHIFTSPGFDFNLDSIPDFVVRDYASIPNFSNLFFVFSGANGSLLSSLSILTNPLGGRPAKASLRDVNGDLYGDIVLISQLGFAIYAGSISETPNNIFSIGGNPSFTNNILDIFTSDIDSDQIGEIAYVFQVGQNAEIYFLELGGVYSYGAGTLTASWMPNSLQGSQGIISITGFNPLEQNICVASSGSPANFQISPGVNVYINPNDPLFFIDCSLSADISGIINILNINLWNNVTAGQKVYAQAVKGDLSASSNGVEFTFLP